SWVSMDDKWATKIWTLVHKYQFTVFMIAIHVLFIVLFGVFTRFNEKYAMPGNFTYNTFSDTKYPNFADTHMMIFVGFGFLMTFLKRYGFSAIAMNMLCACVTIEWAVLVRGFMSEGYAKTGYIQLNIEQFLKADYCAANNLISLGVMLGKLSPIQYVIMILIETPAHQATEILVKDVFRINDSGDSIVVHIFGCYFGIACTLFFAKKQQRAHHNERGMYHAEILAFIGSLFLWVWWPSFNAGTAEPAEAYLRAIINTLLSLVGCTVATFITSQMCEPNKRFSMVHLTNSTLTGGVAIGTTANVVLDPILALAIGSVSGVISTLGYIYLSPLLSSRFRIHDTCGVHNIHGLPGLLSGLFSAVMAVAYSKEQFGASLAHIYPAIAKDGRTESTQALMQLAGLFTCLGISLVIGSLTGLVLRLPFLNQVREEGMYSDADYFHIPEDYEITTRLVDRFKVIDELEQETKLRRITPGSMSPA
ncbi:hypothetical protein PMAYCL1PPCAC_28392, partial [Pristionchus mayeri]